MWQGTEITSYPPGIMQQGAENEVFIQIGPDDGVTVGRDIWRGDHHVGPGCEPTASQQSNNSTGYTG